MIQAYQNQHPQFGKNVRMHDSSAVIGGVSLGDGANLWPFSCLRADLAPIRVGERTNIQDGCVIHTETDHPARVGEDCVVGHLSCIHACTVGNRCLIGIHSTILTGAEIGDECVIGAGALIPEGKKIPPRSLVVGIPGKVVRQVTDEEVKLILKGVEEYLHLAEQLPRV
jgi:carbonic anhydrase/acetyltransferase-like protein (isoleucine patch superfamily)